MIGFLHLKINIIFDCRLKMELLKVAFDNFDEKGPLPNLNDSIAFNTFYKNNKFSERTIGRCAIPHIIMKLWQQNQIEFVNAKEVTKEQKAIYPIHFDGTHPVEHLEYLVFICKYCRKGFKNFTIYNETFIKNIKYILICIDTEPVSEIHILQIEKLFANIPKEKLIFVVNNKLIFKKDFTLQIGVNNELDIIRMTKNYNTRQLVPKEKKFCVLNNSLNSNYDFRQATIRYLKKKNLLDYADYTNKNYKDINYITDRVPTIFKYILNDSSIKVKEVDLLEESIENNSYFSLVLEAYYYTYIVGKLYITEKSLRPMMWKKPFILVGQTYTLKGLQNIGYKTFHPFINEEYDHEEDNEKRFAKAMIELEKLCSKSLDELKEFNNEIDDILEHNFNHIVNRVENMENYLLGLGNEHNF